MKRKIRVALLFGGRSAEHEISLRSAKNVAEAIDKSKYEVVAIGIDKSGHWLPPAESGRLLASASSVPLHISKDSGIALIAGGNKNKVDVVFPILHGPFGEDGTVQGLLRLANIPFVGAGVLGSAVGMDKDVAKRLLRDAGIPIPKFLVATKENPVTCKAARRALGLPLFVNPPISVLRSALQKVRDEKEFKGAMREAFRFDTKVLIEESIKGREIECAVLGNEKPAASVPGEIIVHHDFYSYEAKYLDENGASLEIPAKLPKGTVKRYSNWRYRHFKYCAAKAWRGSISFSPVREKYMSMRSIPSPASLPSVCTRSFGSTPVFRTNNSSTNSLRSP